MKKHTVLIVEDDPDTQFIYECFLEHHGYRVLTCGSGEDGVRITRLERPDVVLMDISIPGIDGWEASRRLKSDPSTAEIPIVVVTAHAFPEDRARAARAGCAGFLTKPCDPALILEAVRGCTSNGASAPVAVSGPRDARP